MKQTCFECSAPADHEHHVVPRVLGGTRTVWLCELHHGMIHDRVMVNQRTLTKTGIARVRSEGRRWTRIAPYGFRFDGDCFKPEPAEIAVVAWVRELRARGLSLRAISSTLAEAGVVARCGKPFGPQALSSILARA